MGIRTLAIVHQMMMGNHQEVVLIHMIVFKIILKFVKKENVYVEAVPPHMIAGRDMNVKVVFV